MSIVDLPPFKLTDKRHSSLMLIVAKHEGKYKFLKYVDRKHIESSICFIHFNIGVNWIIFISLIPGGITPSSDAIMNVYHPKTIITDIEIDLVALKSMPNAGFIALYVALLWK